MPAPEDPRGGQLLPKVDRPAESSLCLGRLTAPAQRLTQTIQGVTQVQAAERCAGGRPARTRFRDQALPDGYRFPVGRLRVRQPAELAQQVSEIVVSPTGF